jgi:dTDP-4-amino-4,6-dideoxygalactose transaminase
VTIAITAPMPGAREFIPFGRTEISARARAAAVDVLAGGWVTMGAETVRFEEDLAAWVGAEHAVAVSSCTVAIEMALATMGLPAGSPVLTPTLTFCGAVQAIVHARLQPVLVDVDEDTLGVSADQVAAAASRTGAAAMVVQHMAGHPLDVSVLAEAAGLAPDRVVEDNAHGLGAALGGRRIGSSSHAACFSFYATKNLPIWEGGAITTDDPQLAERLRRVRLHGMSGDAWRRYHRSGTWRYSVDDAGLKANFTDVQAAVGRAQLHELDRWQGRRAQIARSYDEQLAQVPGLLLPPRPDAGTHAWHLYVLRVQDEYGMGRDELVEALVEAGVGTSVHFIPVHHMPYFRRVLGPDEPDHVPVADRVFPQLLSLPLHPGLSDADVERVCTAVAELSRT